MSESTLGLITPVTRQKAGSVLNGVAAPESGVNAPGATGCAAVIVVFVSLSWASFSQVCAATGLDSNAKATSSSEKAIKNGVRRGVSGLFITILRLLTWLLTDLPVHR